MLVWNLRCMQVLQLRGRFQEATAKCLKDPDGETDEVDTAKGIARLWVEIGEAYSSLIATGRDASQQHHKLHVCALQSFQWRPSDLHDVLMYLG